MMVSFLQFQYYTLTQIIRLGHFGVVVSTLTCMTALESPQADIYIHCSRNMTRTRTVPTRYGHQTVEISSDSLGVRYEFHPRQFLRHLLNAVNPPLLS